MKILPTLLGAGLVAACAGAAAARPALPATYVQADLGVTPGGAFRANGTDILVGPIALKEDLGTGYMVDALVGREIAGAPLAVEGEALYLNNAVKSADLNALLGTSLGMRSQTYGAVGNLKFQTRLAHGGLTLAPFVAAGVGYGHTAVSILGDHYEGDGLLWQAKTGLALETSPRLAWVLTYRYVGAPTYDTNKLGLDAELKTRVHAVSLGMRYSFQ